MDANRIADPLLTDTLRRIPFFRDLPVDTPTCLAVLRSGATETYCDGELIAGSGDLPDLLFVARGGVTIGGTAAPIGEPPGYFGAVELLMHRPIASTLRARGTVTVFRFPGASFDQFLACCQRLTRRMLVDLADSLSSNTDHQGARS